MLAVSFTRRTAFFLAAAVSVVLSGAADGRAAGPRPLFQLPVPCGQVWEASTYTDNPDTEKKDGHWPDEDSVDLAQRNVDGDNISEGEPVLASADGTVLGVYTASNGEHRVYLDHGDGWVTYYIHLQSLPNLIKGQAVAQGEQIGRTGASGTAGKTNDMHIHYTQLKDGKAVRIAFDGKLIDTHAGNEDSYGTYGDGEEITSRNCSNDSILQFNQNGFRYELVYRPGTGAANFVRLNADGSNETLVETEAWTTGWTHLTPFALVGGQQHLFSYKSSTGRVRFERLSSGGAGTVGLSEGTWYKGWTHFVPFSRGGQPYFIAYDSLNGYANIDRINAEGSGSTKISGSTWTKGWTHLVQYDLNAKSYLLLYKGGTGEAKVVEITGSGNTIALTSVWTGTWTRGWTHLVPLKHKGARHLLGYKAGSGKVKYMKLAAGGQGIETLGESTWTTGWTAFTPYFVDGHAYVRAYKSGVGTLKTLRLDTAGTSMSTVATKTWTTGWS